MVDTLWQRLPISCLDKMVVVKSKCGKMYIWVKESSKEIQAIQRCCNRFFFLLGFSSCSNYTSASRGRFDTNIKCGRNFKLWIKNEIIQYIYMFKYKRGWNLMGHEMKLIIMPTHHGDNKHKRNICIGSTVSHKR